MLAPISCDTYEWGFQCPKQWDDLIATDKSDERHCDECKKTVHLCLSAAQLDAHARAGHCVAFMGYPSLEPSTRDVGSMMMGDVSLPFYDTSDD